MTVDVSAETPDPFETASLIVHQFPDPRARARALGVWGGMGRGVALGPVLGGALVAAAGWRSISWSTCRSAC